MISTNNVECRTHFPLWRPREEKFLHKRRSNERAFVKLLKLVHLVRLVRLLKLWTLGESLFDLTIYWLTSASLNVCIDSVYIDWIKNIPRRRAFQKLTTRPAFLPDLNRGSTRWNRSCHHCTGIWNTNTENTEYETQILKTLYRKHKD